MRQRVWLTFAVVALAGFAASVYGDRGWRQDRALSPSALTPRADAQPAAAVVVGPQLSSARSGALLARLSVADRAWVPRAVPLPGGGTRYIYKRRAGDPSLTLDEIKVLIANPPSYARERSSILGLLQQLDRVGALVMLESPRKQGAAGEWEPRRGRLRIRPDVPAKGTREFVRVLNHEAIHVAQSCRAGGLFSSPILLGLSRDLSSQSKRHLEAPLYAQASTRERGVEEEAYANQDNLSLGIQLLQAHCRNR